MSGFAKLVFEKGTAELRAAMLRKIESIVGDVEKRKAKVAKIWLENGLDDKAWAKILVEARRRDHDERSNYKYGSTNSRGEDVEREITGGEVRELLAESDAIEAAGTQIVRVQRLERNLGQRQLNNGVQVDTHQLDYNDLAFLDL